MKLLVLSTILISVLTYCLIYGECRCLNAQEKMIKSYAETETSIQKKYIEAKTNRDEGKIDVLINMMADNSQKRDQTLLEIKHSMYSMLEIVAMGVFVINFAGVCTLLRKGKCMNRKGGAH